MVLQKEKKFYLIGTNASDFEDCTVEALERIKRANVVILSKKFDSKFLKLAENKKIYYQEKFSTKNDLELWKKIYELFRHTDVICHLVDGDPIVDENGLQEVNYFKIKYINCEIISGIIKVVNYLNLSSELLTNREKNFSSTFLKKFNIKKISKIINHFYFEKLIVFVENKDELKQIMSLFNSMPPSKIGKFNISSEKYKTLKNNIKKIEELNTPSYIIVENNEKI